MSLGSFISNWFKCPQKGKDMGEDKKADDRIKGPTAAPRDFSIPKVPSKRSSDSSSKEGVREFMVNRSYIFINLQADDKTSAIKQMVQMTLSNQGYSQDVIKECTYRVLSREELGSTGIGQGLVMPHAKCPHIKEPAVGWFTFKPPIAFDSLDGEPALIACLMLVPIDSVDSIGISMKLLARVSHLLKDKFTRENLMKCESPEVFRQLLAPRRPDYF